MILILSHDEDLHTQRVIQDLSRDSFKVLDFRNLGEEIFLEVDPVTSTGNIIFDNGSDVLDTANIKSVWYRRPRYKCGSENIEIWKKTYAEDEERAVLDGLWRSLSDDVFWLNNPFANRVAGNKLWQLSVAHSVGFDTPLTIVTNNPDTFRQFVRRNKKTVFKPISKSHIERPNDMPLIFLTKVIDDLEVEIIAPRVSVTPCLLQEYIEKAFELRVTIVGDHVFATAQYSQNSEETKIDWRKDPRKVRHERMDLPLEVEYKCKVLVKKMNLTFGAIDLIFTPDGKFVFLEINPNGQWLWIQDLVGYPISHTIAEMLERKET